MGRRSRKRGESTTRAERDAARRERAARAEPAPSGAPARRPASGPRAPWGSFPLSELVILLGIVLILWGAARGSGGEEMLVAGLVIASLGGGELALREHMARLPLALVAAGGRGGVRGGDGRRARPRARCRCGCCSCSASASSALRSTRCASCSSAAPAGSASDERAPPADRRAFTTSRCSCADVERSLAFYRNLLGMRLVKQTVNEDDRGARHFFFGDEEGQPGTLITCLEYPELDEGKVGRGSTHHFALAVESEEELAAWRDYLPVRAIAVTDVHGPHRLQVDLPARSRRPHRRDRGEARGRPASPRPPCRLLRSGGRQRAFASAAGPRGSRGHARRFSGCAATGRLPGRSSRSAQPPARGAGAR